MARSKYKSHPSFISVMYHVFIGSFMKILYKIIKRLAVGSYRLVVAIARLIYHAILCMVKLPAKAGLAVIDFFAGKINGNSVMIAKIFHCMRNLLCAVCYCCFMLVKNIIHVIGNVLWWIKHQFALSNLEKIRAAGKKPPASIGWELYDEFCPRHKLDYWMGDSHLTVEIRWWSYSHKYNRLRYQEVNTRRHNTVHSPHGVPHMISKIHWWEPVLQLTVRPYTPLHTLAAIAD